MPRVYKIRVKVHFSARYIERNSEGDPHAEVAETATRKYQITADDSRGAIMEAVRRAVEEWGEDDVEGITARVLTGLD